MRREEFSIRDLVLAALLMGMGLVLHAVFRDFGWNETGLCVNHVVYRDVDHSGQKNINNCRVGNGYSYGTHHELSHGSSS